MIHTSLNLLISSILSPGGHLWTAENGLRMGRNQESFLLLFSKKKFFFCSCLLNLLLRLLSLLGAAEKPRYKSFP